MLAADVVRFRTAGGAVVTNCVFAAKAAGDVDDVTQALSQTFVKDAQYQPDAANSKLYRKLFNLKTKLVREDMKGAFDTLSAMRPNRK